MCVPSSETIGSKEACAEGTDRPQVGSFADSELSDLVNEDTLATLHPNAFINMNANLKAMHVANQQKSNDKLKGGQEKVGKVQAGTKKTPECSPMKLATSAAYHTEYNRCLSLAMSNEKAKDMVRKAAGYKREEFKAAADELKIDEHKAVASS